MLATMNDVARQTAKAEGKLTAEIEKCADEDEHNAEEKQRAAEMLNGLHDKVCGPGSSKLDDELN